MKKQKNIRHKPKLKKQTPTTLKIQKEAKNTEDRREANYILP